MPFQSQTLTNLRKLLAYLPRRRNQQLVVVMVAAFFQGGDGCFSGCLAGTPGWIARR